MFPNVKQFLYNFYAFSISESLFLDRLLHFIKKKKKKCKYSGHHIMLHIVKIMQDFHWKWAFVQLYFDCVAFFLVDGSFHSIRPHIKQKRKNTRSTVGTTWPWLPEKNGATQLSMIIRVSVFFFFFATERCFHNVETHFMYSAVCVLHMML